MHSVKASQGGRLFGSLHDKQPSEDGRWYQFAIRRNHIILCRPNCCHFDNFCRSVIFLVEPTFHEGASDLRYQWLISVSERSQVVARRHVTCSATTSERAGAEHKNIAVLFVKATPHTGTPFTHDKNMSGKTIIFDSDYPKPYLPRTSVFDHLFPEEGGALPTYDPRLPAYVDGLDGRVISRGELKDRALRVVTGLRNLGFQRGDTACLWGINSLEWTSAIYGLFAAGAVVSPANVA